MRAIPNEALDILVRARITLVCWFCKNYGELPIVLRLNSGNGGIDLNVAGFEARLLAVQIELELHPGSEDQAVRGPAEVEHAKLIALVDMLANGHRDVARRDLRHSHGHETHQPYPRIICLNQDDGARGHFRDVGL